MCECGRVVKNRLSTIHHPLSGPGDVATPLGALEEHRGERHNSWIHLSRLDRRVTTWAWRTVWELSPPGPMSQVFSRPCRLVEHQQKAFLPGAVAINHRGDRILLHPVRRVDGPGPCWTDSAPPPDALTRSKSALADQIKRALADQIKRALADQIKRALADQIKRALADQIKRALADQIKRALADQIKRALADQIKRALADQIKRALR
ncbi:unnamed protein product [Boreogadus saida]